MGRNGATAVRYVVLAWLCLAATIAYVCRNSLGVAETTVRTDLGLKDLDLLGIIRLTPKDQMGWAMGAFFLTYALCQLPTGWLGYVWGTRRALPFFSVLWSVTTGVTALAGGFPLLLLTRLGGGAAQAGIFPCATDTVAKWFPATRRALPSGFLASFMSVGGAAGAALTSLLLLHLDWRWIFVIYSVPGVLWAVAFYLWFRDRPEEHAAVSAAELAVIRGPAPPAAAASGEPTPWRALFTSAPMAWICGQQFCRAAGYIFFSTWFATYLQEHRAVSVTQAGLLTSLPLAAVVLGSLAGGQLSDWVLARTGSRRWSRQGIAAASLLACALLTLLAHPIENDQLAVLVVSAGSFCASVAGPCSYSITIDMGGRHVTTVFSTMNMAGNLGAFVFPIVVPALVRLGGWDGVYFLFVGIYLVAALCWLLLNPNGTVFDRPAAGR